jgi:hypothetical protein
MSAGEGLPIWIAASNAIAASDPGEKVIMFETSKTDRDPTLYDLPDGPKICKQSDPVRFRRGWSRNALPNLSVEQV